MAPSAARRTTPARLFKTVMKSHRVRIPKYEHLPLRLRLWFIIFTVLIMFVLAFLGFTNFSRALPLNDKALHFLCLGLATFVFYFIFDVEEDSRRIWFWRNSGLMLTGFFCFFCGGILSEFVQSMLPSLPANDRLLSSNLATWWQISLAQQSDCLVRIISNDITESGVKFIARLYQPLDAGSQSDLEDDDEVGLQLLPTHNEPMHPKNKASRNTNNIWDAREELFDIGADSDEEDSATARAHAVASPVPKIYVSST
ncbi:unnamed protein product [Mycena citricolor]|uniref:Uncharacterized protein n=1 Tax=Mycena citricolor TaxID=2018698 RepID=A0AAD2Q5E2_9AGAR|nr:unnamed protein product [Mycena citricolor]